MKRRVKIRRNDGVRQRYWIGRKPKRNYGSSKISRLIEQKPIVFSDDFSDTNDNIKSSEYIIKKPISKSLTNKLYHSKDSPIIIYDQKTGMPLRWSSAFQERSFAKHQFRNSLKNYGMAPFKINLKDYGRGEFASKVNFDPQKTVVHGTSKENAVKIIKDGKLREGTYLYPGVEALKMLQFGQAIL